MCSQSISQSGKRISRRHVLMGATAVGALVAMHPFSARASGNIAHLRVMETTDLHVHVYPYDYYSDRPVDTVGLARTASLIKGVRAEATNAILVDNGDFLQGNPMGDYIAYERGMKDGDTHPVITAMNTLGFDASTLGNHEFNYGLDFLLRSTASANFPIVSANVIKGDPAGTPTRDSLFYKPYVIVTKMLTDGAGNSAPIRIGFIGFVPPQIMVWDRRHLQGKANTRDIVETARAWVPQMKEEGADIIIALSHSGIGPAIHSDLMENASVPLAQVEGIDALMTGHSHLVFPSDIYRNHAGVDVSAGTIHGKPATMGGFWGSHLGLVDLLLQRDANTWRLVDAASQARPIYKRDGRKRVPLVESQRAVLDSIAAEHEATLAYIRRPVGNTTAPLHSYFSLVADDPSVQIVNQAQKWYVGQMLQGTAWAGLPMLSAAAPFKAGGRSGPYYYTEVAPGSIAIKNVADLYLYPNTVRVVAVSGAQLREWLEMSAGIFNRIEPGKADQNLINASFPSYNFDVIDGVTYRIDLTQPARYDPQGNLVHKDANRIVDLRFEGVPVDPMRTFIVATNNYRAGGGGNFPDIDDEVIVFAAPDTNRDVIVRYIVEQGTINPSADANWTFKPIDGASALFDTGPGAKKYAADVKSVKITPVDESEEGFTRYRLTF